MSGVQQRLKLKQTPIDTWSLKEHLTLASAVLKNGDQNWVSVSRTMKQLGEGGRPSDWFKDKNCALQYNLLLEKADIPTRKRGEKADSSETPAQRIVNQLAQERIAELKIILEKERLEILKLEEQTQLLSSDDTSEEQLEEVMKEVEAEEAEEDAKEQQAVAWLQSREEKKMAIQAALKSGVHRARFGVKQAPGLSQSQSEQSGSEQDSAVESPIVDSVDSDSQQVDVESLASTQPAPTSFSGLSTPVTSQSPAESPTTTTSPLLTSLLQSPTRPTGSVTSPIKCAAISNLAQKLASPTLPFSSSPTTASLPPALLDIAVAQTSESTLSLNKTDDVDLKETLIDLDELLKKELEGVEKDVPEEVVKEPVVEAEPEKEEKKVVEKAEEPKIEPEEKSSEILEVVSNKEKEEKEEKEDEMFDSDKLLSRRVGRPRKTTETETKTKPIIEEDQKVSKKKEKDDVEKPKITKPGSPRSRQASPSPEVKTRSGSREPPTKRSNSGQEQIGKKIEQPITKKVEPSQTKKLEQTPVKKPAPAPVPVEPPVESAPASPEVTAEEIERQVWKKSILAVLGRIMQHKHAHLFNSPVSEAVAPEYRDLVYRPMDLGSIKKNIESGHIDSTEGMLRDINLVFLNAIMYNSSETEIYALTISMQSDANRMVEEFQTGKLESPLALPTRQRGRSVSGTGLESPVSSRSRTVSSSGLVPNEETRKRARTSSVAEDGLLKKRRLRNIEEN